MLPSGLGSHPKTLKESPSIVVSSLTGSFDSSGLSSENNPTTSQPSSTANAPTDYEDWLRLIFPRYATAPLAEHHHKLWQWVWALERGVRPDPLCVFLARGGAKSTSAEMACAAVGARGQRRYILYVSGKQDQADDHVGNVAGMLESDTIASYFPKLGERSVGKHGNPRGWRRNRIRTAAGLTVDALGLDTAARGIKLDEQRPDMIIFDDVDETEDSLPTVEKKVRAITQKLLPAGSPDLATLFVQNIVHYESVAARLAGVASVPADFLAKRAVVGPIPAVIGLQTEPLPGHINRHRITAGVATWAGQSLAVCQSQIDDWGLPAFLVEAQHLRPKPKGQSFPEFDVSVHVVDDAPIPSTWVRWRAIDYGYAAPYCCLWFARRPDGGIVVYNESYDTGKTAGEQALEVRVMSSGSKFFTTVGDPSMWASNKEGQRYKSAAQQYMEGGIPLVKASNDRVIGWGRLHELLAYADGIPPRITIMRRCQNLIRTFPLMVQDKDKPEDIDTTLEDHALDSLRYGVMAAHWLESRKPLKQRQLVARG